MTTDTQKQAPTHRIYAIKGEGKSARWIEIGAAWPNQDRKGFFLRFESIPVEGLMPANEDNTAELKTLVAELFPAQPEASDAA